MRVVRGQQSVERGRVDLKMICQRTGERDVIITRRIQVISVVTRTGSQGAVASHIRQTKRQVAEQVVFLKRPEWIQCVIINVDFAGIRERIQSRICIISGINIVANKLAKIAEVIRVGKKVGQRNGKMQGNIQRCRPQLKNQV